MMRRDYLVLIAGIALFGLILFSLEPGITGFAVAGNNLNLNIKNNLGINQNLEGSLNVIFRELNNESYLRLYFDNEDGINLPVRDLKCLSSAYSIQAWRDRCKTTPENYILGSNINEINLELNKDVPVTRYGIRLPSDFEIEKFEFDASSTNSIVTPNIAIKGQEIWKHTGDLIQVNGNNVYIEIPQEYEKATEVSLGKVTPNSANNLDMIAYCEKIRLVPSRSFRFEFYALALNNDNNVRVMLFDKNKEILNKNGDDIICNPMIRNVFGRTGCDVSVNILKEDDYFVCVNGKDNSYSIGTADGNGGNECILSSDFKTISNCNNYAGLDYYFDVGYANYSRELTNVHVNLTDSVKDIICPYIMGDGRCLIPLTISAESDGNLRIYNVEFKYRVGSSSSSSIFSNVDYISPRIINGFYGIELSNLSLRTPATTGNHTLNVELVYNNEIINRTSRDITLYEKPVAVILGSSFGGVNIDIKFDGSKSNASNGSFVKEYIWRFGDGTSGNGMNVSHKYTKFGVYYINLSIVDDKGIKSDSASKSIVIGSIQESVEILLNETESSINSMNSQISSNTDENINEIIGFLNLKTKIEEFNKNLSEAKLAYNNLLNIQDNATRESGLGRVQSLLMDIRGNVPKSLYVSALESPVIISQDDIIDEIIPMNIENKEDYKKDLFAYQSSVGINAKIYSVKLEKADGSEEFRLIKKNVNSAGKGFVYEIIPKGVASSINAENILTQGYSIVESDPIIKYPITGSLEFRYKIGAGELNNALDIKTIIVPDELKAEEGECNYNGICERPLEDEIDCPEDCKGSEVPWLTYIILGIVLILGIYYFNVYKGPGNFESLMSRFKKKIPFKNANDLNNLVRFIKNSKGKYNDEEIKEILRKKGWTKEQIEYAFKMVK